MREQPGQFQNRSFSRQIYTLVIPRGQSRQGFRNPGLAFARTDKDEALAPEKSQAVQDALADIAPDMARFIQDFSYGDVISRPGLSPRRKELAMIAASIARGTMRPQLKVHVKAGLNVGLARAEIVETAIQMASYAGFPASLNGLGAVREAFAEVDAAR